MKKSEFVNSVENMLCAELTHRGFVSRGRSWIRVRGPFIDCVDVQIRSDERACCVNLGEHLSFLPCAGTSRQFDIKTSSSIDCEMKSRLAPDDLSDYWWDLKSGLEGLDSLVRCFRDGAFVFFDRYVDFPLPFTKLTIEEIDSDTAIRLMPTMTKIRRVLLMSRVYAYLEDHTNAEMWARFGSENCGVAVGLKASFQEIIRNLSTDE
ncbi:MAG: DUF4304 domain-containing protein [Planctomycetaceae bacterium]|nr:DUF4304 domain-containing protein [Planctomycetaceae bacterium]